MSLARPVSVMETEESALVWVGKSGRHYRLLPESFPGFQLRDGELHVLVSGSSALWAGSASDVVADPQSRMLFRQAMSAPIVVYRLEPAPDEESRPLVAWDILGGHPAGPLKLLDSD